MSKGMRVRLRWAILVTVGVLMTIGLISVVRAKRAVDQLRADVAGLAIPFEIRPLSEAKPTMVDFLPAPPDFRDAQIFHDLLYTCGAGGVWVYDLAGNLRESYLAGRDLPASPAVAMTAGAVAG